MNIKDYNYTLPTGLISTSPPKTRGSSRLLVLNRSKGSVEDKLYQDIIDYLQSGDVLVLNNTKVIKARLEVVNGSGLKRELVILEKHGERDNWFTHKALYKGKLKIGEKLNVNDNTEVVVEDLLDDGIAIIKSQQNLLEVLDKFGTVPLPPYMHRRATKNDILRYQTLWAKEMGSVAAPTASLNMTTEILDKFKQKGVRICYLTLHVGLGTFLPIRVDNIKEHVMHKEYFNIPIDTIDEINAAKSVGKKVVALGTTVARTLEYIASDIQQATSDLSGEADIFIYPGYEFKVVDGLITNFHAPKSTVLMLASAFVGWDNLMKAYEHAITNKYHFLSYGDSMLIL